MSDTFKIQQLASQIRRDVIRMTFLAQSGHPGGALGCADFFATLYSEILHHNPKGFSMNGENEDLFFLSNGHLSAGWYSVLARTGYFDISELANFRKMGSKLQGHPSVEKGLPGVRVASGSLGMGLSNAIGAAMTKKINKDDKLVYCLMGDGELQEGQVWEAAMFAASKKIDNLIALVDYNRKQIDGPVKNVMDLGDIHGKWHSFGWEVFEMNGNHIEDILSVMSEAKSNTGMGKPIMIIMRTEMGYGVDFMTGDHNWHGKAPDAKQAERALNQIKVTLGDF